MARSTPLFVFWILVVLVSGLISCTQTQKESEDSGDACIASGDLVVSNSGSDAVLVLNPDGTYKNIAFNVSNIAETVYGITWSQAGELLVAVDGADRIVAVSPTDCSSRTFVADGNLSGTLRGMTQLAGGDILIVETNNVERFTSLGIRVSTGGWPRSLQTAGTGISKLASGGFIHCSNTTDVVRTYDSTGATQVATVSSGIAATTDALACLELNDGTIAAVWSGTTDTVRIYSSNLSTTVASYSDTSILSTPGGIAQRANGNLLVIDRVLHYIVEITNTGSFVNIIGDGVLNTPEFILVVP